MTWGESVSLLMGLLKTLPVLDETPSLLWGLGGVPGLVLNSGLFGYQTFEAEKSDLLNKGADIKTARTGGAIKGVTDALGFAIPYPWCC